MAKIINELNSLMSKITMYFKDMVTKYRDVDEVKHYILVTPCKTQYEGFTVLDKRKVKKTVDIIPNQLPDLGYTGFTVTFKGRTVKLDKNHIAIRPTS